MENQQNGHKRRVRYSGTHPKRYQEKYKELHPEILFRLVQNPDREHDDICISTAFPGTPLRYGEQLLLQERFFMAVPAGSPYAGLDGVDLACLKDEGFISLSNNRPHP